ncbi:hypothetical protein LCGC14_0966320 [marine sediment metagenome]|uniref:MoaD/ThiS family protein n=1 Tax=marine sediment metagenome TaxID=412755 RepID=A0A0F9ND42_9ZZZZ|nr:MoaD/ThiS family protein [archaeon]
MIINILYFAELKEITNKESEKLELVSREMKELIDLIIKKYPSLQDLIWDQKTQKLRNTISIIINNQSIHTKDPLLKKLNDADTVAFLLPVSGG